MSFAHMHRYIPLLFILMVSSCASTPQRPLASETRISTESIAGPDGIESGKLEEMSIVVAPMERVEEGVYASANGYWTQILELAGGRYRYWESSDVKTGNEPPYPLTGKYVANGIIVRLDHQQRYVNDIWAFRKLNGQTTLWDPGAIELWHESRTLPSFGLLFPTNLKPEDIWKKGVWVPGP